MSPSRPDSAFDAHEAPTLRDGGRPRSASAELLVLVVDDDGDMREMHCMAVSQLGYRTIACSDGVAAVEMNRAHHPDVILMDVAMPGMDGIEATRLAKQERGDVFVVVMTAYGDQRYFDAAFEAGCDAFLCKPFNPFVLEEILAALQNRRSLPVVKTCACGRAFTLPQWKALSPCGFMADVELRNCWCGSSLALRLTHDP